jgi:iron complex transport system ATP-binding protein
MSLYEEIVITRDLTIGYSDRQGSIKVMSDINVSACRGELVALIGRNGSGKSTLLRSIVSLQNPLSGEVYINNCPLFQIPKTELTKTISFTSTEPIDIHNIRVSEAVASGRYPYTNWLGTLSDEDRQKTEEALTLTGLIRLQNRKIYSLSDGERQRVLIARSLAQDTELLVMDEPTAYLDLPSRYSIVSLLRKLSHEKNKCIIFSTHDLDTALNEADKIWLMKSEKICQGAPEDLVINKSLSQAFEDPFLSFSTTTGTFSLKRNPVGTVSLEGTGQLRRWTERALNRIDFKIDPSSKIVVYTELSGENALWHVQINANEEKTFRTLYDLVNYLAILIPADV